MASGTPRRSSGRHFSRQEIQAESRQSHKVSTTALVYDARKFSEESYILDSDGKLVDRSTTSDQLLRIRGKGFTLLKRGNPFALPTDIKRQTQRSKRVTHDPDTEFNK